MDENRVKLPKFKLNSSLIRLHYTYASLVEEIDKELRKIPSLEQLKLNPELTKLLCSVVENLELNKSIQGKIEKKTLVVEVLTNIFKLTEDQQKLVGDSIDFMCSNGLIKASSKCDKFFKFFF